MIHHIDDDLFNAPPGSHLLHACNCMGVWGSGIAVEFKERYPNAYRKYVLACQNKEQDLVGTFEYVGDNVVCLFTSVNYGPFVDDPALILKHTEKAFMSYLCSVIYNCSLLHKRAPTKISMPRINSGKFNVPWPKTEKVLEKVLKSFADRGFVFEIFVYTKSKGV